MDVNVYLILEQDLERKNSGVVLEGGAPQSQEFENERKVLLEKVAELESENRELVREQSSGKKF